MTNSTTHNPSLKKQGPFRTKATAAIAVLSLVLVLFCHFFLDATIKKTFEWTATYIHGAQVDIGQVKTSFVKSAVVFKNIQVTDKKKPTHNMFSVEKAQFRLLMDALLRAKFVVEDAAITGVKVDHPRRRPGQVLAKSKTIKQDAQALSQDLKNEAKSASQVAAKEMEGNFLGNLASLAGGAKAKGELNNIRDSLASEKMVAELELKLTEKEKQWQAKLKSFEQDDKIKQLQAKIKKTKFDKKNPLKSLKQYNKLQKEVRAELKKYKSEYNNLKSDINYFESSIKDVKKQVAKDKSSLIDRFSLGSFDAKSLGTVIFMKLIQEKLGPHYKYLELAQEYLPQGSQKEKENTSLVPRKRSAGVNISFPITTGYPLFWWKQGKLSVTNKDINFNGVVRNISTSPELLKDPATLDISGSLPKKNIQKFSLFGKFDHRHAKTVDLLHLKVSGLPVKNQSFISSDELSFGIDQADTTWDIRSKKVNHIYDFNVQGLYSRPVYNVTAKNNTVQELFSKAVQGIPQVSFQARGQGQWENINWSINSPFTKQLEKNLKREAKNKVTAVKNKYLGDFTQKIDSQTQRLQSKYNKIKDKFNKLIGKQEKKAKDSTESALNSAKESTKKSSNPIKSKSKKKLKKLFKKLKF